MMMMKKIRSGIEYRKISFFSSPFWALLSYCCTGCLLWLLFVLARNIGVNWQIKRSNPINRRKIREIYNVLGLWIYFTHLYFRFDTFHRRKKPFENLSKKDTQEIWNVADTIPFVTILWMIFFLPTRTILVIILFKQSQIIYFSFISSFSSFFVLVFHHLARRVERRYIKETWRKRNVCKVHKKLPTL